MSLLRQLVVCHKQAWQATRQERTHFPRGIFPQTFPGVADYQNNAQIPGPPEFPPNPTDERFDHCAGLNGSATRNGVAVRWRHGRRTLQDGRTKRSTDVGTRARTKRRLNSNYGDDLLTKNHQRRTLHGVYGSIDRTASYRLSVRPRRSRRRYARREFRSTANVRHRCAHRSRGHLSRPRRSKNVGETEMFGHELWKVGESKGI